MNPNTNKALSRQEELVIREMPDEVLVYDLRRHKGHCLNQTAAFVWNCCDGKTSAAEIAQQMSEMWQKPVGEEVVWFALEQLEKAKLLQYPVTKPHNIARVSRRSALRHLGVGLPLVISIIAPTAASAASTCTLNKCQDKGSTVNNCGACEDLNIKGNCFENNGCGNGKKIGTTTMTCSDCFKLSNSKSWECKTGCF